MSSSSLPLPACVTAYRDISSFAFPKKPQTLTQQFFPWDALLKYFQRDNREWIRKILECSCDTCAPDAKLFDRVGKPTEYIDHIIGEKHIRPDWSRTAVSLFALTIYIRRPQFITPFVQQGRYDSHLEEYTGAGSINSLPKKYWPNYAEKSPNHSAALARDFVKEIPQFSVPRLDSARYVTWEADRILPFFNQEELGSIPEGSLLQPDGANSRVFSFEIHDEYRRFKEHPEITKFARKEIQASRDLPPVLVALEKEALERVGNLSHPHIVKLIKSYRLGDNYNIIFPCARTNLDKFLRDPNFDADQKRQGPVEYSSLWGQLCGITGALAQIHSYGQTALDKGLSETERLIGFHFDLKDANILVEQNGTWVISDFGQATFKDMQGKDGSTTRVLNNQGGTDSYAPPEFNSSSEKLGRGFDIWSLGCIFLEVTSFIVRGYDGLTSQDSEPGLDVVRRTKGHGPRREDHRFYTEGEQPDSWIVKPEIEGFMKGLQTHINPSLLKTANFLSQVLHLIKRMLSPLIEERPEASEVLRNLEKYLRDATQDRDGPWREEKFSPPPGYIEVEKDALAEIAESGILRWDGTECETVRLHILQSEDKSEGSIQIISASKVRHKETELLRRSALVSRFAFLRSPDQDSEIYFIRSIPDQNGHWSYFRKISGLDYYFTRGDINQKRKLQSIFIGQQITGNFEVQSITLTELPKNLIRKSVDAVRKFQHARKQGSDIDLNGKKANVQLWTEYPGAMPEVEKQPAKSRKSRAEEGQKTVPPRRVVFYCQKSIILMRIERNQKIKEREESEPIEDADSCILEFVPTQKERDESFMALILHPLDPAKKISHAAIPLDHDWLRELEEGNGLREYNAMTQEYISIKIRFKSEADRNAFKNEYISMKTDWRDRRKGKVPLKN